MIPMSDVTTRIQRVAKGALNDQTFDESMSLTDLGLSSLQVSDLIFTLEEDFEIEFDTEQAADVKTLGQLLDLVNNTAVSA